MAAHWHLELAYKIGFEDSSKNQEQFNKKYKENFIGGDIKSTVL